MRTFIAIIILFMTNLALPDQDIEIIGGVNLNNPKVAIINFTNDADQITKVIANDLNITGEFTVTQYSDIKDIESSTQYVIIGSNTNDGISYKLLSTPQGTPLLNQKISYKGDTRKASHIISNNIYQKITNVKGVFTTKIAYIIKIAKTYQIIVSDYDGYNQKVIFNTNNPVSSLAWNKTGNQISYVSFESGKPVVYVQDIYKGSRYKVANFDGSNSSPAFTPDDKQLAVTLTKDYGSHIYLVHNKPYNHRSPAVQLINFGSIDTEASFANNGNLVFTSNHDGGPQIFISSINGAAPTRLTLNLGNYNTTARFSHDSSKITFINRNIGVLKAYVMDIATKTSYPISLQTNLDMSPSFAPNDKLILYSSSDNHMYIGNINGTIQTQLNKIVGEEIIDERWANNY